MSKVEEEKEIEITKDETGKTKGKYKEKEKEEITRETEGDEFNTADRKIISPPNTKPEPEVVD